MTKSLIDNLKEFPLINMSYLMLVQVMMIHRT